MQPFLLRAYDECLRNAAYSSFVTGVLSRKNVGMLITDV
jgi:hypothetical protein